MAPGKGQQEALDTALKITRENLAAAGGEYSVMLSGGAEEFAEAFKGLGFLLLVGLLVAYMVLASQFNSFVDPFTVFVALPFSFSGAFLGLLAGGQSLNIFSMIGLVLLMGIVKKNSILLVDFTHRKREEDELPVRAALMEACPVRWHALGIKRAGGKSRREKVSRHDRGSAALVVRGRDAYGGRDLRRNRGADRRRGRAPGARGEPAPAPRDRVGQAGPRGFIGRAQSARWRRARRDPSRLGQALRPARGGGAKLRAEGGRVARRRSQGRALHRPRARGGAPLSGISA
jgi:hypothetical protein